MDCNGVHLNVSTQAYCDCFAPETARNTSHTVLEYVKSSPKNTFKICQSVEFATVFSVVVNIVIV